MGRECNERTNAILDSKNLVKLGIYLEKSGLNRPF